MLNARPPRAWPLFPLGLEHEKRVEDVFPFERAVDTCATTPRGHVLSHGSREIEANDTIRELLARGFQPLLLIEISLVYTTFAHG